MDYVFLGLGNYNMSDDSVGLVLAEMLADKVLPGNFEVFGVNQDALQALFYFEPSIKHIVVADAVLMGLAPGTTQVFSPEQVETRKELAGVSSHEGDVLQVIALGRSLGYVIPPITIVGIQPENMEWGTVLSPPLQNKLNEYAALIEKIMEVVVAAVDSSLPKK